MSRSWSFRGTPPAWGLFLATQTQCPGDGPPVRSYRYDMVGLREVWYGEGHPLRCYYLADGRVLEEFVQEEPWRGGPETFLGLRDARTKAPVAEFCWAEADVWPDGRPVAVAPDEPPVTDTDTTAAAPPEPALCQCVAFEGDEAVCRVYTGGYELPRVGFAATTIRAAGFAPGDWFHWAMRPHSDSPAAAGEFTPLPGPPAGPPTDGTPMPTPGYGQVTTFDGDEAVCHVNLDGHVYPRVGMPAAAVRAAGLAAGDWFRWTPPPPEAGGGTVRPEDLSPAPEPNPALSPDELAELERLYRESQDRLARDGPWPETTGDGL